VQAQAESLKRFYSGDYIAKKLCGLAKTCEFSTSLSDIDVSRLLSKDLVFGEGNVCSNPEKLKVEAAAIHKRAQKAALAQKVLRYVARVEEDGNGRVFLNE